MKELFSNSYLSKKEIEISSKFLNNGYYIGSCADESALTSIRNIFFDIVSKELGIKKILNEEDLLNSIHKKISIYKLNDFRLHIIRSINSEHNFRKNYYKIVRPYLDILIGNELAMQAKVNLSIQYPNDSSSLLPIHADTWSGDSPFEVVVWIPLVNCYKTKSMYILPQKENVKFNQKIKNLKEKTSDELFNLIEKKVAWIDIKFGEVLLFNMGLPHGNRVNEENETRWSMNCRFKGLFTPYSEKKLGSFFVPITLRAASINGMDYQQPEIQ